MAFFIGTGTKFLGSKGIFREVTLVDLKDAVKWELHPHDKNKNEYYICDEGQHFIKRYRKDGLAASGNLEQRAVITINASGAIHTNSKFTMQIDGVSVGLKGLSLALGADAAEFIVCEGKIPVNASVNLEEKPASEAMPQAAARSDEISAASHDEKLSRQDVWDNSLKHVAPQPASSARVQHTACNKDIDDTAAKIQANMANAQTIMEQRIMNMQKEMKNLLRQSEECSRLAEKCQNLENSIDRLSALTVNTESYQHHLDELLARLPKESGILFDCECDAAKRLEKVVAGADAHKAYMESHLATMEKKYQEITSGIVHIKEEQSRYAEKLMAMQPEWNELQKWHKENIELAQHLGKTTRISDMLDEIQQKLKECDQLLNKELTALNASIPQIIQFN